MKKSILGTLIMSALAVSAQIIPLKSWSLPGDAVKSDNAIKITSGKSKNGNLMWAPFQKTENNKVWKVSVKLAGKGDIQASLGCYDTAKKRFITRHPFADDIRKIDAAKPVEQVWYVTLPQLKEVIGYVRPVLRITAGEFEIQQVSVEAFETMPLIEEYIPLAKFAIPATARLNGSEITATSGNKKNGELLWGPFRPVGGVKVWQVTVEYIGRGDLQCSLGCYDATKKRFITRYPFADGNRELNTVDVKKEVWLLTLPAKSDNIKWVRPTLRILTGEFTIKSVHVKELEAKPPVENKLDTSVTMPGEILPVYFEPNLFPGFPVPGKKNVGLENELVLENKKNASRVFCISKPIPVESGKKYILTGLYHSHDLKFGNRGSMVILTEDQAKKWPESLDGFKPYSPLCMGELVNRTPGVWQRKTAQYTAPEKVKNIRIGIYLSGNPASIKWRSIYFGLGPWEKDSRIQEHDNTRNYRMLNPINGLPY